MKIMKFKPRYAVLALEKVHPLKVAGIRKDLDLVWADRMCGVIPVFEIKKAAEAYAGKKYEVFKIEAEV